MLLSTQVLDFQIFFRNLRVNAIPKIKIQYFTLFKWPVPLSSFDPYKHRLRQVKEGIIDLILKASN